MELIEWLVRGCGIFLDAVTFIYRLAYAEINEHDVSVASVAFVTWLAGTLGTLVGLAVVALLWDALFFALRWRSKSILSAAMKGANLTAAQRMASQYVKFDQSVSVIQGLSGVVRGYRDSTSSEALSTANLKAWLSRLAILVPSAMFSIVNFIIQPATIVLIVVSTGSAWWVIDRPDLDSAVTILTGYFNDFQIQADPVLLSAVGVCLAALTFVLSRMRSANARGHQEWLRGESTKASNDLAVRELALSAANNQLYESLWAIHSRWRSSLTGFDDQAHAASFTHEWELRTRLRLSVPPELERNYAKTRDRFWSAPNYGPTVRDRDIVKFDQSLDDLNKRLRGSSPRSETRLLRSVPWKTVRPARASTLKSIASQIETYSARPSFTDPELTEVDRYLRRLIYTRDGAYPKGEIEKNYAFESIDVEEREDVLGHAVSEWEEELEQQRRRLSADVHRRMVNLLIAMAKLQLAEERIGSYIHPTSIVSKIFERLKGA